MAFKRQVKNFVKNYSDAEIKVREATSNDPWGPSSSLMLAISDLTFNTISLSEIMNMLWQRLSDHGKNWRHVYKSLMLLDYLIKNGSKEVIQFCIEGFYNLKMLKDFQHIDEAGKDQGYYIREKSKQVVSLLMDEQLLHKEREAACRTRRRGSYPVALSERLPGAGHSPTAWASDPSPEVPASEKKCKLLKVSRLRKKKNTPKAESKQERWRGPQSPGETMSSQGALPLKCTAWKSAEDLMLFYEDDPKPPLLTVPPAIASSTTWLSEGQAEVCNLWDTVSTTSEVTSSFSTLSMSSPDSATPEKSAPLLPPILAGPSFWTVSHPQGSPASSTDREKAAGVPPPFVSGGPLSSDEETDNFSPPDVLPDHSELAKKNLSPLCSSNWVKFSAQNVGHFSRPSVQTTTEGWPGEPEANSSIPVLLGEVKNAIVTLHKDLSLVIQELGVINSHLVSMGGNSLQTSTALQGPPSSEGSSEHI
ncbi:ENTH domain containing 1 [Phyllostomus discolor]|uniref:ENTH domain containing 1 n=1 Tax=Phyllostomus discolor TaxID=89673 RepID=A0A834EF18_9CHIR|nr:ENTH domain containing 1 [Phyllostomus discolor]